MMVGPVLKAGPLSEAVVAAIRKTHPHAQVVDRGSYIRVGVPHQCLLDKAALETAWGRVVEYPQDLEHIMVSFQGRMNFRDTSVEWTER